MVEREGKGTRVLHAPYPLSVSNFEDGRKKSAPFTFVPVSD